MPILFTLIILLFTSTSIHGATIQVPADFSLIQDAIHAAQAGDTIEVAAGTYYENLLIGKSISLVGEDRETTFIDGQSLDTVIYVQADHFAIRGFTVRNSATGWPHAGLLLNISSGHTVTDNIFITNYISIHISETSQVDITGNLFKQAGKYSIASFGWSIPCSNIQISTNEFKSQNKQIYLTDAPDSSITDNFFGMYSYGNYASIIGGNVPNLSITGNEFVASGPISLSTGSNITVSDNECKFNSSGSIRFYSISRAEVENNYIEAGSSGISLHTCSDMLIKGNTINSQVSCYSSSTVTISNNLISDSERGVDISGANSKSYIIDQNTITNPSLFGILLDADDSHVSNNLISHSGLFGIDIRGSFNEAYENTIISCISTGLEVSGNNNKIFHNNFFSNSPNASLISGTGNLWDDGYPSGGNYWSDYQGADSNGDGIGDTIYNIDGGDADRYPLMDPTFSVPLNVMNMDTGKLFFTIQSAIDDPDTLDGHTIFVPAGTYYEFITLSKSLHLRGENAGRTILDGGGHSPCVTILSPGCTFIGFTIRRCPGYEAGLQIESNNNVITDNLFELCYSALLIEKGLYNIVTNNRFRQNTTYAIDIHGADFNTISDNNISATEIYGIFSSGYSNHNWITGNHIEDCSPGIYISSSDENMISGNTLVNLDGSGITISAADKNVIQSNVFRNITGKGIWLGTTNVENLIFHNNFTNITEDTILDSATSSSNSFAAGYPMGGNYYDDHSGPDLYSGPKQDQPGSDGIIDQEYAIPDNQQDRYPLVNPHAGLAIDVQSISAATGGTVQFTLDSGPFHAGRNYVILGSVTGVLPGTFIPNIYGNTLPLNWDSFTNLMIPALNSPVFDRFLGQVDMYGTADATLNTTGHVPPDGIGITLSFSYALYDLFDIVSNPVGIVIVP